MNTMDEHDLTEISVLARALGWESGSLSQFIAMRLVPVVPPMEEMNNVAQADRPMVASFDCGRGNVDVSLSQQPSKLTAQDVAELVKELGLRYRVGTTTASDTLIVEGQGMMTPEEVIQWLRTGIPLYATQEIAGTTYRIALETLINQLGVK
jgi:hypothetical protein